MGCEASKPAPKLKKVPRPAPTFGKKAGLDPKDFMLTNIEGQHPIVKKSIQGQQFIIENCKDCTIFLVDHIASLTVDLCSNVTLVTGPVESSVFIRECSDCNFVIACQQLRTRDCKDCKVLLMSTTGPIVESSVNMGFGCYSYNYFNLLEHIEKAGLNVWNNSWYSVYDFTPKDGTISYYMLPANSGDHNSLLTGDGKKEQGIDFKLSQQQKEDLVAEGVLVTAADSSYNSNYTDPSIVPRTYGPHLFTRGTDPARCVLVCVPSELHDDLRDRMAGWTGFGVRPPIAAAAGTSSSSANTGGGDGDLLLRTVVRRLDVSMVDILCSGSSNSSSSSSSSSGTTASSLAKFKAALKKKKSGSSAAGKKPTTATAAVSSNSGGGSGIGIAINDSIIALQILLPATAVADPVADVNNSIAVKLQLTSKPNLTAASASVAKQLGLGLGLASDAYFYCSGSDAVEKTRLVFEQWAEQT